MYGRKTKIYMVILRVLNEIRTSKDQHFISVNKNIWKYWGLIIRIFVILNKNYKSVTIYRKKYKFLSNIVVVGLKTFGKNTKRRTSGFAKEFIQANKDAKCIYCGSKLTLENATTDHIIPISKGGSNVQVNLVVTCFTCNNERGNIPFNEYLKLKNPNSFRKVKFI